jgi:hypothetical protein
MGRPKKLKVYVWNDVLTDYTSGMMFAIAGSKEEAREVLLRECAYLPQEDLAIEPEEYDMKTTSAFICWGGG